MSYKPTEREYRVLPSANIILRDAEDGKLLLRGTPILFNTPAVLLEIDGVEYKEIIARGA